MIRQIHLYESDSTQNILKEQLSIKASETLVVSCDHQTKGKGRGEKKWISMTGSLCFSINLKPHPILSFTAMEISVILADFFLMKNRPLKLKWPNDVLSIDQKKCGGILVQGSNDQFITGIGINLFSDNQEFGGVYESEFFFDKKDLALEIAQYIIMNRISDTEDLKKRWLFLCGHLNKEVTILEGENKIVGTFKSIGDFGEALIYSEEKIHKIFNGSLVF